MEHWTASPRIHVFRNFAENFKVSLQADEDVCLIGLSYRSGQCSDVCVFGCSGSSLAHACRLLALVPQQLADNKNQGCEVSVWSSQ